MQAVFAAGQHPVDAYGEGAAIGKSLAECGKWVLGGALLLSVAGTVAGFLPGTRERKSVIDVSKDRL